jgi:hypothetical protein
MVHRTIKVRDARGRHVAIKTIAACARSTSAKRLFHRQLALKTAAGTGIANTP